MIAQEDVFIDTLKIDLAEHACVWGNALNGSLVFELRPPPVALYGCAPFGALSCCSAPYVAKALAVPMASWHAALRAAGRDCNASHISYCTHLPHTVDDLHLF